MEHAVSLSLAPVGVRLTLAAPEPLETPGASTGLGHRRLAQLGLRPGAEVRVVMRTSGGGRVVAVAGSRVALDHATAQRLRVTIPEDIRATAGAPSPLARRLAV